MWFWLICGSCAPSRLQGRVLEKVSVGILTLWFFGPRVEVPNSKAAKSLMPTELSSTEDPAHPFFIDAHFPGGNILVERIEGDTVCLRQNWNTSREWWFGWNFAVRGAQGRSVRFEFCDGDVFGACGPCVKEGDTWRWLGLETVRDNGFCYSFGEEQNEVGFAFCPPYVESDLDRFLASRPFIERGTLCLSEEKRPVEHLVLRSRRGARSAIFTARTHACEATANFVLEGILDGWSSLPEAAVLRDSVDFHAVPFVDKDGVEKGEQGKNRAPHDHNRDFSSAPLYASTRALVALLESERERGFFFLDLHCPWIRGGRNEHLFFLGAPPGERPFQARFMEILQREQRGPLPYDARHTLFPGQEWFAGTEPTSSRRACEILSPDFASVLEVPYARAGGVTVTPQNARAFGLDVCRALSLSLLP